MAWFEDARRAASGYLEQQVAGLRAGGAAVAGDMVIDSAPARVIVERAGHDPIVMATRGHGGWKRTLLGSVTDKVARGAEGPVLVVPPGSSGA